MTTMMKKVTYYRLKKDDDYFDLYESLEEAKKNIVNCLHYEERDARLWSVKKFTSMVKEVLGELRNWGNNEDPNFHVSWNCPSCGKTHDTDLEQYQNLRSHALWLCEYTEELHVVYWGKNRNVN